MELKAVWYVFGIDCLVFVAFGDYHLLDEAPSAPGALRDKDFSCSY